VLTPRLVHEGFFAGAWDIVYGIYIRRIRRIYIYTAYTAYIYTAYTAYIYGVYIRRIRRIYIYIREHGISFLMCVCERESVCVCVDVLYIYSVNQGVPNLSLMCHLCVPNVSLMCP